AESFPAVLLRGQGAFWLHWPHRPGPCHIEGDGRKPWRGDRSQESIGRRNNIHGAIAGKWSVAANWRSPHFFREKCVSGERLMCVAQTGSLRYKRSTRR